MELTKEEIKQLCKEMPYFTVRNAWTGEVSDDYDYTWSYLDDLPIGWGKVFLQMCKDIKQPLIDAGLIDTFYFTQVKEKYNTMRCYNSGATEEIQRIIDKYEYLSYFVCQRCGKPATKETQGWFASYCDDCYDEERMGRPDNIEFNPIMTFIKWNKETDGEEKIEIDCSEEWRKINED